VSDNVGTNGWIHVARTEQLTHFAYDARRGRDAMEEVGILPQLCGTLVRDGYLSYSRFERCRHSLCNAHLLRDLIFVEELSPAQKAWTKPLSALLIEIKKAAAKARAAGQDRLGEESKGAFLRRYDRLIKKADRLNPPPTQESGDAPKKKRQPLSPQRRLLNRLLRRRDEVLRFMTDLSVPFDNNGTERDLRMVKLQQKIGGCFHTEEGAAAFCRIRSYLSTARKQGYGVLAALERAFRGKPIALLETSRLGPGVCKPGQRDAWLAKLPGPGARGRAERLY